MKSHRFPAQINKNEILHPLHTNKKEILQTLLMNKNEISWTHSNKNDISQNNPHPPNKNEILPISSSHIYKNEISQSFSI